MQLQSQSQDSVLAQGLDNVAQAIISVLNIDQQPQKQSTLNLFLIKLFKNNTSSKPKKMNSIRLSRFNAFLYRINHDFPQDSQAVCIVYQCIMAAISNDKNFQQEEDEQTVMSIAKWICIFVENAISHGFCEHSELFLKYVVDDAKQTLLSLAHFQQEVKKCQYVTNLQLNAEDERQAFRGNISHNITSAFNLKKFILKQLKLQPIYKQLYESSAHKKTIMSLFMSHFSRIAKFKNQKIEILEQTFLNGALESAEVLETFLQILNENYFNNEYVKRIITKLIQLQINLEHTFNITLKGTKTEQLFFEILCSSVKTKPIEIFIHPFLSIVKPNNIMALYMILNSTGSIPKIYISLLLKQRSLLYQHGIVLALAISHNIKSNVQNEIIDQYVKQQETLTAEHKKVFIQAIYYSLTEANRSTLSSNISRFINLSKMGQPLSLQFVPLQELRAERLQGQYKNKLVGILDNFNEDNQKCLRLKIQLLRLCGCELPLMVKIRELNTIFQRPVDQILASATNNINKDPHIFAVYLMGLNSKLQLYSIEEPNEDAVQMLITKFLDLYNSFGKTLASLDEQVNFNKPKFYVSLVQYNFHTRQNLGCKPGDLGDLLDGSKSYQRVSNYNFSEYFINQQKKQGGRLSELWASKKILFELRDILVKVINFEKIGNNNLKKQVKGLLEADWGYAIGFKLLERYFLAERHEPQILKQILSTFKCEYSFFEMVEKLFSSQFEEYVDVLQLIPKMLQEIYPQTISYLAKLICSQPVSRKDKEKGKNKGKNKNYKTEKKDKSQKNQKNEGKLDQHFIFDNESLFESINSHNQLKFLFRDASQLDNFDQLFKIIDKFTDKSKMINSYINEWLPTVKIFHCQKDKVEEWKQRLLSYCQMWKKILIDKKYIIDSQQLERHFLILTELLNTLYEFKNESNQEIEFKVLTTLLLIYQSSLIDAEDKFSMIPSQSLKNLLLGYRLPLSSQQQYFQCFTCSLSVCQICAPFFHKNHDLNYTGKDGYCVHDDGQKRKPQIKQSNNQRQRQRQGYGFYQRYGQRQRQRERQRRGQRLGYGDRDIFAERFAQRLGDRQRYPPMPSSLQHSLINRDIRKDQEFFSQAFEFNEADQDLDFGQHIKFKQIMQFRLKEQKDKQKERQKDFLLLKQKERAEIEKLKEEIVSERQIDSELSRLEIRSQSSKSIKNIEYNSENYHVFKPEFNPEKDPLMNIVTTYDSRPLRHILLRELQQEGALGFSSVEKGKITVSVFRERYNFFNKSNYFRSHRSDYGLMRGINLAQSASKKNLLSSNKKFLVFPSASNGILIISITNMVVKFQRRQTNKNFAEFEQERTYLTNAVNNANISFEPYQLIFSRSNPNLLAVVGLLQLGFLILNNEGKIQKFMQTDFKSNEAIIKFQWMGKQRNIFAVSSGGSIRIGNINEEMKVKTASRFKIHINKPIRDFQINVEGGLLYAYIIDNQGVIYRSDFDYREPKTLNVSDKRMSHLSNLEQLQSLIFIEKKIFVSGANGKCYLLKVESKNNPPSLMQTFDLDSVMRHQNDTKNIKAPFFLSQLKIIHHNQNTFSLGCILKKGNDPKKIGGYLAVVRVSDKNNLQLILLSEEDYVQSFQVFQMGENNYLMIAVQSSGSVWLSHYTIPSNLLCLQEQTKLDMSQLLVSDCNKKILNQNLLEQMSYYEPKRYLNFKQTKDMTANFNINVLSGKISALATQPNRCFITGICFIIEPNNNEKAFIEFPFLDQVYKFESSKPRQIQIPLHIKQTLDLFVLETGVAIFFSSNVQVKNVKIYGLDFSQQSIYKRAYSKLFKLVTIHFNCVFSNLQHYLQNIERNSIVGLQLTDFQNLKTYNKYSQKQLNLLMKLELLRITVENNVKSSTEIQQILHSAKCYLMPLCEKRQFLTKSCCKLIRKLSQLVLGVSHGKIGHPLQYKTILDFYYFERYYYNLSINKNLTNFEHLTHFLYSLIFRRVGNLYLIFKLNPNLIYEMTYFYKACLHSMKGSKVQDQDPSYLNKVINICSNYVALICEYYQVLKNTTNSMVDQAHESQKSPEKIVLDMLEEVFCAIKKQLYRQIFISPELYLEKLYLSKEEPKQLDSAVNIFEIQLYDNLNNHASRKASISQQQAIQESESQIQLEEQSEKQMMEEQAREMIELSEQKENSAIKIEEMKVPESKTTQITDKFKKSTHVLTNYLLGEAKSVNFIYYQFSFQMIIALFELENYLNNQNSVFYMGFFFNLLRIVEMNLQSIRDRSYIIRFFEAIHRRINSPSHSIFFNVLNYFFEPRYGTKQSENRKLEPCATKISGELLSYYKEQGIDFAQLFLGINISKTAKTVSMSEANKSMFIQLQNQLYQLKFLGNSYLNLKLSGYEQSAQLQKVVKQFVLRIVVIYKLRIFNNIMLLNGWSSELEGVKVEVGFSALKENVADGIRILHECAKKNPRIFIDKLTFDPSKIQKLQSLLDQTTNKETEVFEMLTIYYGG